MNKKIIICTLIMLVVVVGFISYAATDDLFETNTESFTEKIVQDVNDSEELLKSVNVKKIINILKKQGLEDDEIQVAIDEYIMTIMLYEPTKNEIKQIEVLIKDGKDLLKLCKVYAFLYNTAEGPVLLNEVYMLGETINFSGLYWIETAYNTATENKHGILNMSDIHNYIQQGITTTEMRVANALSRMSDTIIHDVLDERAGGAMWSEIFAQYLPEQNVEWEENADAVILMEKAILNRVANNNIQAKEVVKLKQKAAKEYTKSTCKELKKKEQLTEKIHKQIEDESITIEDVSKWQNEGFSSGEIKKAAKVSKEQDISIDIVLEKYKARNVWIGE